MAVATPRMGGQGALNPAPPAYLDMIAGPPRPSLSARLYA